MEKTEYKGSWFVPEKPDAVIPGLLHFEKSGRITLDLQGTLTDPKGTRPQSLPLILGKSTEGTTITLYGCIQTNTSWGIEGVRETSFLIVGVLIGAHFSSSEGIVFGQLTATFPQLDYWIGSSGVKVELPDRKTMVITKQSSFLASAKLPEMSISIGFSFTDHSGKDEVSVKYVPFVSIELKKEIQLKKLLDLLYHLCNFFALAVCLPVYAESINGFTETVKVTLPNGKPFRRPIKIIYGNVNWGVPLDTVDIGGMLFEFAGIRDQFESILKKWFDKVELLEPIYGMYFGTLYNKGMYLQHKFLSLVQCVESYHRRVVRNYELPQEQAERRVQEILKSAPDGHRDWLRNKLRYSNEPTLRKRLEELVQSFSFVEFEDTGQFIEDVVNTRNYLTHYDKELKELSASPAKMSSLARKLAALTEAILLTEFGLPADKVKSLAEHISQRRAGIRSFDF
ncbi:MAG: HEPN domain-containing protein [Candidatus Bathyarchaeia archaeon]